MTSPAATPPAGTADLREMLTPIASWLAARDGYSFTAELSDRERDQYLDEAGRLAQAAALPIASLRERTEAARRSDLAAEDAHFAKQYGAARSSFDFETIARTLSGRLRQMDKRAKAANTRADDLESRLATLAAENEALRAALTDPVAVHVNMLAGKIAKPSIANIVHLYGADALRTALVQGGFDAA